MLEDAGATRPPAHTGSNSTDMETVRMEFFLVAKLAAVRKTIPQRPQHNFTSSITVFSSSTITVFGKAKENILKIFQITNGF
jgi:hypothetical protein